MRWNYSGGMEKNGRTEREVKYREMSACGNKKRE